MKIWLKKKNGCEKRSLGLRKTGTNFLCMSCDFLYDLKILERVYLKRFKLSLIMTDYFQYIFAEYEPILFIPCDKCTYVVM